MSNQRCYFIAEAGCNHLGRSDVAIEMIRVAKSAGADAVKFQTFQTTELYHPDDPEYAKLLTEELPLSAFANLAAECRAQEIDFLSTPFDQECVDCLDDLNVDAFKIGSGELDHLAFLQHVGSKRRPVILSTGMSDLDMIRRAVGIVTDAGCPELSLLHCVSAYPSVLDDANVRVIDELRREFACPVGLSDHCLEPYATYAAVARGANIIEKHFTLGRTLPGDDHPMSLEPSELAETIAGVRAIESALGDGAKTMGARETHTKTLARRGLYARVPIAKGTVITAEHLLVRRPPHELGADAWDSVVGAVATQDIAAQDAIGPEMFTS